MPKKNHKKPYSKRLICGSFIIILVLTIGTIADTLDDIWSEMGRRSDTKKEYFVSHFVGGLRNHLLSIGSSPESWYIRLLTDIDHWAYRSAIAKIPENDFEKVFWYHRVFYLPVSSTNAANQDARLPELAPEMELVITRIKDYEITSRIDRDVNIHSVINSYTNALIATKSDSIPIHQASINAICWGVEQIDPAKIASYNFSSYDRVFTRSIRNYYLHLKNDLLDADVCPPAIYACWEVANQVIDDVFIKDAIDGSPKHFRQYISEDAKLRDFLNYHKDYGPDFHETIKLKCNTGRKK